MFISPYIPFPNILWWSYLLQYGSVLFDGNEHFEKMSYRNKLFIAGPNEVVHLSIPIVGGRGQRTIMQNVLIDNTQPWQKRHWKTIESVYNRSPYFQYYKDSLQTLFSTEYKSLTDFNAATVIWVAKKLSIPFDALNTENYVKHYPEMTDVRKNFKPGIERKPLIGLMPYQQIFSERLGFFPNLSILDLLFSEGPYATQWIKDNSQLIETW